MGRKAGKKVILQEPVAREVTKGRNSGEKITAEAKREDFKVLTFYGVRKGCKFGEFSNFFSDTSPFMFELPAFAYRIGLPRSSQCEFSEKAIMLTKAAMMGDFEIFHEIEEARDPKSCKALGRGVRNFDDELWKNHLEETAFEVVRQKFESCRELRQLLLSTGSKIIAEAAPNDSIWGIGLRCADDRSLDPAQWCGQNILGYALMRVRSFLRGEVVPAMAALAADAGHKNFSWLVIREPHSTEMHLNSTACELRSMAIEEEEIGASIDVETFLRPASNPESGLSESKQCRWSGRKSRDSTACELRSTAIEEEEIGASIDDETFLRPASDPESRLSESKQCRWSGRKSRDRKNHKASHQCTPFVFDMETGDPDDVLTLLFLGSHPSVDLRAVTITPGSEEQVALVRWLLQQIGQEHVRLGAQQWPVNAKKAVNLGTRFYKSFGRSHTGEPHCERADQVLLECCDENVTLVTGGPLHNLGDALKLDSFSLGRWVAQGGFAGEGVVPRGSQMDKFKGMVTCPTWNFGGNIDAARAALGSPAIARKICVSKNVCHSVVYEEAWHKALEIATKAKARNGPESRRAVAFSMMYKAMDEYLQHKPGGKKLHDPLALAVALDESVCELAEVELFCQKGQWGSRLSTRSNTWISIAYDDAKFQTTLLD